MKTNNPIKKLASEGDVQLQLGKVLIKLIGKRDETFNRGVIIKYIEKNKETTFYPICQGGLGIWAFEFRPRFSRTEEKAFDEFIDKYYKFL
jgi:hypothetical protein